MRIKPESINTIQMFLRSLDWTVGMLLIAAGLWLSSPWLLVLGFVGTAIAWVNPAGRLQTYIASRLRGKR